MTEITIYNDVTEIGSTVKSITLNNLKQSPVQRGRNEKHVANIVNNFDNRKFGVISVVKFNGEFIVIDGMHRIEALNRVAAMQGVTPNDVFVTCQIYPAKSEIDLVNLLEDLNNESRRMTTADYLFSQQNVEGTDGNVFMKMLKRIQISIDKSSSDNVVVLKGVAEAFKQFKGDKQSRKETVEDALRLLKLVANQKAKKEIKTTEFTVMMKYAKEGGDLKSARVRNAVIAAGEALFIQKDNQRDVSVAERLNHFVTVLNSHM